MSGHQSEALALRTYPYAESHKIAVFLTRDFGKVRGVAYGAQKAKGRFSGALEPLTYVRLTFSQNENQELASIKNCEILKAFPAYQLSLEVNLHFSYFAELLVEFSREQEESELLFRLSLTVLEATTLAFETGRRLALTAGETSHCVGREGIRYDESSCRGTGYG
jgi:DNA repair protein RecO (recombination protein O)